MLDVGAAFLPLNPTLARRFGRFGWAPLHRPDRRLPDQFDQAIERIFTVPNLCAMALSDDDDGAVIGQL
jgi:hypothetical protein